MTSPNQRSSIAKAQAATFASAIAAPSACSSPKPSSPWRPAVLRVVAALPVLGVCAMVAGYRQGGVPVMFAVLGGYLDGMLAKAAFLAGLGLAWAAGAGLGA